jgi:hypothetical protein
MAIFLPGAAEDQALALDEMTPREIVAELDKYVVGQHAAKRAVAIALRNRMRRQIPWLQAATGHGCPTRSPPAMLCRNSSAHFKRKKIAARFYSRAATSSARQWET